MPLAFNLRHLEDKDLHLRGDLPAAELELENVDELIHLQEPLHYDLEVEKLEKNVLVHGRLSLPLHCECARCLKPFTQQLNFDNWICHLALEGEEQVVVKNDCVDLTPYFREDILLAFPQHPLCKPECGGLAKLPPGSEKVPGGLTESTPASSAWAELNKLKFEE